jgi:hypothetical protein
MQVKSWFGQRWLHGVFCLIVALSFVQVVNMDPESTQDPVADRLIASPNDPHMIEAIRMAQAHSSKVRPWGGAERIPGPAITLQTLGGPLTLTRQEIVNANQIYPQLKDKSKNLFRNQ